MADEKTLRDCPDARFRFAMSEDGMTLGVSRYFPPTCGREPSVALIREQVAEAIRVSDVPACVTGGASMFRVHFKPEPPVDYRSNFADAVELQYRDAFLNYMFDHGIIMINTASGVLSTPMNESEIDTLAEVMLGAFRVVREMMPQTAVAGPEA